MLLHSYQYYPWLVQHETELWSTKTWPTCCLNMQHVSMFCMMCTSTIVACQYMSTSYSLLKTRSKLVHECFMQKQHGSWNKFLLYLYSTRFEDFSCRILVASLPQSLDWLGFMAQNGWLSDTRFSLHTFHNTRQGTCPMFFAAASSYCVRDISGRCSRTDLACISLHVCGTPRICL